MVGRVLIVDVKISVKLEHNANIYSHHHCLPNNSPGKIIAIFVAKDKASIKLTLFQ
jgi:hypothetical protein